MKLSDVRVYGRYLCRVSGRLVSVLVLEERSVRGACGWSGGAFYCKRRTRFVCRNEETGRLVLCSAARLRPAC
jgi:hypothetical protein